MKQLRIPQSSLDDLKFFEGQKDATISSSCKAAGDFLISGVNAKLYSTAANKLGVDFDDIRRAIEALMLIMTEGAKLEFSPENFEAEIAKLDLPSGENLIPKLTETYARILTDLMEALNKMVPQHLPAYKNLEWRLDIDVATRSARELYQPIINLKLDTLPPGSDAKIESKYLTVDPGTLLRMTSELEKALSEIRTREFQKITKQI